MPEEAKIAFPRIYEIHYKPSSGCEFFQEVEAEGFYLAKCRVIERFLIRDFVFKCEKFWKECPFRKMALRMESRSQ